MIFWVLLPWVPFWGKNCIWGPKKKLFTKPNKSTQGHLKMILWASRIKYLCLLALLGSYLSKKVNNIAVRCIEMILEPQTRDRCDFWIIMSPPSQFLVPKKRLNMRFFAFFELQTPLENFLWVEYPYYGIGKVPRDEINL